MNTSNEKATGRPSRAAWLLAGVALLVGLDLGARLGDSNAMNAAYAQEGSGVVNPADQRNRMIAELKKTNERLERLGAAFDKAFAGGPVDVAVVEFPKNLVVSGE